MQIKGKGKDDYFYIGWLHLLISIGFMRGMQLPFSNQCGPIMYGLMYLQTIFIAIQIKIILMIIVIFCFAIIVIAKYQGHPSFMVCSYVHTFTIEALSLAADGETFLLL